MGLTKGSLISHNMPRDTVTMFPGDAKAQQAADAAAQKAAAEARARCQQNPSEEDVALQAAVNGDLSLIINLFRKRKIDGPAREELIVKNEKLIERIEKLEAEAFTYQTQISAMDGQLLRAEKLVERTNQLEAEHVARFSNEPPAHLEADGLTRQQIAELLIANRTLTRSVQSYANEVEQYKKVIARLQPENDRLRGENYKVQEEAAFLGKRVKCYKAVYPEFNVDAAVAQLDAAPSSTPPSTGAVMQSAQAIGVQVSDAKGVFTSPPTVESKPNGGGGGGDDPFGVRTDLQFHDASQEMPPADSTPHHQPNRPRHHVHSCSDCRISLCTLHVVEREPMGAHLHGFANTNGGWLRARGMLRGGPIHHDGHVHARRSRHQRCGRRIAEGRTPDFLRRARGYRDGGDRGRRKNESR